MSGKKHKQLRADQRRRTGQFPYGRTNARRCFLLIVSQQASEVITDLYPTLRPMHKLFYQELMDPGILRLIEERSGVPNWVPRDGTLDEILDAVQTFFSLTSWPDLRGNTDLRVAPVRVCLLRWSKKHHLEEEWCLNVALATCVGWMRQLLQQLAGVRLVEGRLSEGTSIHAAYFSSEGVADPSPFAQLPQRLTFDTSGWNDPFEEDPALAMARLEETFRAAIEEHIASRAERLKEAYGEPRSVRSHPPKEHYEWLVAYQCEGKTFDEIAREAKYTRQAVSVPVNDLANLMGLKLRKDGRGRPRGAKDHGPRSSRRRDS